MTTRRRSFVGRALRGGLWVLTAAHLAEALVLRRRLGRIATLPAGRDPAPGGPGGGVVVVGADPDAATRDAAARALAADGLDVIDLVPGDLPADRALRLLRRLAPERLRTDPLHTPGGAHEALALRPALAARLPQRPAPPGGRGDRGDRVRRTVTAQRYAPLTSDVRIAPALRAAPAHPVDRWRELDELTVFARPHVSLPPLLMGLEAAHLVAMGAGAAVAPVAALAALASWSAQPALVFAGQASGLRPPGLVAATALRFPASARALVATVAAGVAASRATARRRPPAPAPPPPGTLFEPRRSTCPWCGARSLRGRLDITDLLQHKPGTFHLDECRSCGHVFQNPALSLAGLDHYYDQFYEGEGEEPWEFAFAAMGSAYRARVEALARVAGEPRAWLDVGTGHGHFCLVARQRWPSTTFDGLDLSASVDEAARRGWVDTAHRGLFPELADSLPRSYDVVSMHHYLEHTRDPRAELAAAAKALAPGGHLMIEGPDIECPWARRLGRYWRCWFQPQHQHFVTCPNLVAALREAGFDVVAVERGPATEGLDLTSAVSFWVNRVAPDPRSPWRPVPSRGDRARRLVALTVAAPAAAAALAVDVVKDARLRRPGTTRPGNAYRVVARRL